MRFEHKLSPSVAAYAQRARQQLAEVRREYLVALGLAKEHELRGEILRQALSQQLALVQESEGLPQPAGQYELSEDGRSLVGEIPDEMGESNQHSAVSDQLNRKLNAER
jgi:hypothetical protein